MVVGLDYIAYCGGFLDWSPIELHFWTSQSVLITGVASFQEGLHQECGSVCGGSRK